MISVISLPSLLTSLLNCGLLLRITVLLVKLGLWFPPCLPIFFSHLNTILWVFCSSFCTTWVTFWFWLPSIPTHIICLSILDTGVYSTSYSSVLLLLSLPFKFVLNYLLSPMSVAIYSKSLLCHLALEYVDHVVSYTYWDRFRCDHITPY